MKAIADSLFAGMVAHSTPEPGSFVLFDHVWAALSGTGMAVLASREKCEHSVN